MNDKLKAPFPYFGGKGMIAHKVWEYLGDCKQYIEPFFGSGAVLLQRPESKHERIYEIINDKDCFIPNVWRSIIFNPDEVAKWCDFPINHVDLNARRKCLVKNEGYLQEGLTNDPEWYDAKLAGYWIWSASCWIGSGLTRKEAITYLNGNLGIQSKRPHLNGNLGIQSKRHHLTYNNGILTKSEENIYAWINLLSKRLRNVKVVCGDWSRVCGGNWQNKNSPVGMFFDPPYATESRYEKLYHQESLTVAKDVEKWILERGKIKDYRIVVAGYDDEYQTLIDKGWEVLRWSTNGGYSNTGKEKNNNRHRECIFISPYCLKKEEHSLF